MFGAQRSEICGQMRRQRRRSWRDQHIYLGEQAERDKDRSAAIAAFRTVLQRDPHYEPAMDLKLKVLHRRRFRGSGRGCVAAEAGLQVNSSSADLWGGLAEVYRRIAHLRLKVR